MGVLLKACDVQRWALVLVLCALFWPSSGALGQEQLNQDELRELEALLAHMGFEPGVIDGKVEPATLEAIARYNDFAFFSSRPAEPTREILKELRGVAGHIEVIESQGAESQGAGSTSTDLDLDEGETTPQPDDEQQPVEPEIIAVEPAPREPAEEALPEVPETPIADAETVSEAEENDMAEEVAVSDEATEQPAVAAIPPPPPPPPPSQEPASDEQRAVLPEAENPAASYLNDGIDALNAGEVDRALALLTTALAFDRQNPLAYQLRGSALAFKGRFDSAIEDFDKAVALAPDDPEVLINRCWIKGQAGQHQGALDDCGKALRLNPQSAEAHHSRAQVYEAMGSLQYALADYAEALRLGPDRPEILEDARRVGLIE